MTDLQKFKEKINELAGDEGEEDEQIANEQRNDGVLPLILSDSRHDFNNRKVEVNDEIRDKVGEGTAEVYRNVLTELNRRLQLESDTKHALNKLKNIFDNVEKQGAGGLRNQINKVANRLGLDTQVSF